MNMRRAGGMHQKILLANNIPNGMAEKKQGRIMSRADNPAEKMRRKQN
jgi:hypothetical protein